MFLKIGDVIPVNNSTLEIKAEQSLKNVIQLMVKNKLTWLPVTDEKNQLIGRVDIFTLLRKESKYLGNLSQALMPLVDPEASTIHVTDQLEAACYYPVERTVIDQEGNVRGILNKSDIIRALVKELSGLKFCLEKISDGIIFIDKKGQVIFCNSAFASITGEEHKKIMGANIDNLLFLRKDIIKEVFESGEIISFVTKIMGRTFNCQFYPVIILNKIEWIMVILSNMLVDGIVQYPYVENGYEMGTERGNFNNGIVYKSQSMKRVFILSKRVASVDVTVLITGETGVGKEVIANYIHSQSKRACNAFIQINCGAIPENLLESELFGYEKGAFTGANREGKRGLFEAAEKGTILLDEISEMPLGLQVKLLRVLQHGELFRIGSTKPKKIDVRIIAATNKDLKKMIEQGKFREDLYYRLHVVPIQIPPLRERLDDIKPLAEYFLKQFNMKYGVQKEFSTEIFFYLKNYKWPGNIRELQNLVEQMVIMSESNFISMHDLPSYIKQNSPKKEKEKIHITIGELIPLKEANTILEKKLLTEAVGRSTSIRQAAKSLGVDHSTMLRKLNKYNMSFNNSSTH